MGCCTTNSIEVRELKRFYHKMSEDEKEKIKKETEEQDKNIIEEESIDEDPRLCGIFDLDKLKKKLPISKTPEDRQKRLEIWNQVNEDDNDYTSFKKLSLYLLAYLKLSNIDKNRGPIKSAFIATRNKYSRYGLKIDDNIIIWMEFRIFLVYLRQYYEYWVMFKQIDDSNEHQINLKEFKKAVPLMGNWGVRITDSEKEFNSISRNSETISFEEFCSYAISKSLDLEEEDDLEYGN